MMDKKVTENDLPASERISAMIAGLPDWRGPLMARLRALIHDSAPGISEEWKWETAVFSQNGNVVAIAAFKDHVKLNFFKGAALENPYGLFNAGLEAKASRGIDFGSSDEIPESALRELILAAIAANSKKKVSKG